MRSSFRQLSTSATCPTRRINLALVQLHLTGTAFLRFAVIAVLMSIFWAKSINSAFAQAGASAQKSIADLTGLLKPLIEEHRGEVAVCVRHIEKGDEFHWRSEIPQPTASLIKLPVMIAAYRLADSGKLNLNQSVVLTEADKVPGSGILTDHFSAGLSLSIRDAIRLMIRYSDNTATNLVIDQIGLPTTSQTMNELGFPDTQLHAKVFRGESSIAPERSQQFGLGSTTAKEMVDLLTKLANEQLAGAESTKAMLEHLAACDDNTKAGRELPEGARFAHKTGAVAASRCDAGILTGPSGRIAVCILTTKNDDQKWNDDNTANVLCGRIAQIVYDHFNPTSMDLADRTGPKSGLNSTLQIGAFGQTVEMLQRTLNARLNPSPALAIDGDFGPSTESAVKQFQDKIAVPVTGIVDASLWKALGPIAEPSPVEPPEVVNNTTLPIAPPDSLEGPPFVTCRAWTIVDADNGATLFSANASQRLDFASTTKIMTAWLVVQHAILHPEILEERLSMSERADQTIGSTSALHAGESVSIREALYGLMLPSGNDMSVALAEHFGRRFAVTQEAPSESASSQQVTTDDPLDLFVAAMNAEAARLGMSSTHYMNPHGLTHDDHRSTASDLAVLARAALQNPLFQHYVSTRRYGVAVTGASGYERNVVWENTNQLLGIEGYDGVKTGTTDKAGACLVSTGSRNGRRLIMVVLGSAASDSRYADSRNLYRWAWKELALFNLQPRP
ncbi:MAG: serine hydrolase [Planctomyces sp.]|nr:serine hydrolase [Planctomyces sp.]